MMNYEEPKLEIIILQGMGDVVTLSVDETDPSNGEKWWN